MRTTWLTPALAYLIVCAAPGCLQDNDKALDDALAEGVAVSQSPIQGGYQDDTSTHVVGLIRLSNNAFGGCTGTLIAPNTVLTARHCVAPSGNGGVVCGQTTFGQNYDPDTMYVTTRTSFTQNGSDYYRVKEIINATEDDNFCGYDIAIMVLDEPVPASEAVPVTPRVDSSLVIDEEYYAVGYGQQFDSNNAPSGTRHRRDGLVVRCVSDECLTSQVATQEFVGDTGVCQGDSGGPAMDLQNRVVGVASRGGAQCTTPVYGHVFGHSQWIKDVTAYATSANGLDVPPWTNGYPTDPQFSHPVGAECAEPSQCPSNICFNGICTRNCTDEAFCPDGFLCAESGFCEQPPPPPPPEPSDDDDGGSTTTVGCAVGSVGQDPTKPIPWEITPLALGALLLLRRRRS